MKKLFFILTAFALVLSCSSDETSTPVTPPPAPIVKYTITLTAGEGGTVSTTGGEYESGQTVSVTATPQGEYVFTSWSDGNTDATRTITISSNSTLTANFEKRKYPLTVNFDGEGEVIEEIVNSGRTTEYDSGTTVKLTAQAAAEWVFIGWTGDIESTEESVQIVIGEPKEVTATFEKKKYPLSVNIEGEGEVIEEIVEAGRTTDYDSGTTVKLTAEPADEWLFTGWSGDIGEIDPTENPIQLTIIESKTVTATFEKRKYPLTLNIEGEGEVLEEIVNAGRTTDYDSGTTVKLTAVPAEGWEFVGWTGALESAELEVQLLVSEAKEINGAFKRSAFVSKSERYSAINETTAFYNNQKGFDRYLYKSEFSLLDTVTPGINYQFFGRNIITNDFNKDGRLDLVGLSTGFDQNSNSWGYEYGKYIVVDDFFSNDMKKKYYNSEISLASKLDVGDFDNDGNDDILIFQHNTKQNAYNAEEETGGYKELPYIKQSILFFNNDLSYAEVKVGIDMSVHGGTSGDVDNDGDIDIITWPVWSKNNPTEPMLVKNLGGRNFVVESLIKDWDTFYKNYGGLNSFSVELFDVNSDGNLDLLVGAMITFDESISPWVKYRGGRMPFILFGDETGKFSFENSYIIELNNENLFKQNYILGFAFSDFDNDGDIDIMINSTRAESAENGGNLNDSSYYNNHIVYGIENKENTTYIDSSNLFFDKHYLFEPAIFPDFYEGKFIDKDGDGDFDYVPATPPNWGAFDYISNFYYNKSNKSFTQRLED